MKTKIVIELETSNIKKIQEEGATDIAEGDTDITNEVENDIHRIFKEEILGLKDSSSAFYDKFEELVLDGSYVEGYESLQDYGDILFKINVEENKNE